MLNFLSSCIKRFGWKSGIQLYLHLKILKSERFVLPGLKSLIHFRQNTSDLHTFREVFLREEYAINIPFTPQIIIDAGANIGFTTLFFIKRFPSASIYSLEPDKANFELLQSNTRAHPNITPIQSALFNKVGEIKLADEGLGVRGYMVKEMEAEGQALPCTTILDLLTKFNIKHIDILKIDIEGSEKEVFENESEKWLPKVHILIIELHDRMKSGCSKAVFKAISNHNFECSIRGENLVFTNKSQYLVD